LVVIDGDANDVVDGASTIDGGLIVRGNLLQQGDGWVRHHPANLASLAAAGAYVAVPGSWIDE
jgi:hypothetical protein